MNYKEDNYIKIRQNKDIHMDEKDYSKFIEAKSLLNNNKYYDGVDIFNIKVQTIPNSKDILLIYAVIPKLKKEKETPKRLSRIEKFNQKYGTNL